MDTAQGCSTRAVSAKIMKIASFTALWWFQERGEAVFPERFNGWKCNSEPQSNPRKCAAKPHNCVSISSILREIPGVVASSQGPCRDFPLYRPLHTAPSEAWQEPPLVLDVSLTHPSKTNRGNVQRTMPASHTMPTCITSIFVVDRKQEDSRSRRLQYGQVPLLLEPAERLPAPLSAWKRRPATFIGPTVNDVATIKLHERSCKLVPATGARCGRMGPKNIFKLANRRASSLLRITTRNHSQVAAPDVRVSHPWWER